MKWENFKDNYPSVPIFTNKIKTNIECPQCGEYLFERTDIVLSSYPETYQYECTCGFIGYSHADWVLGGDKNDR